MKKIVAVIVAAVAAVGAICAGIVIRKNSRLE